MVSRLLTAHKTIVALVLQLVRYPLSLHMKEEKAINWCHQQQNFCI